MFPMKFLPYPDKTEIHEGSVWCYHDKRCLLRKQMWVDFLFLNHPIHQTMMTKVTWYIHSIQHMLS